MTTNTQIHPAFRPANAVTEVLPQRIVDRLTESDIVECALLCEGWKPPCDSLPCDELLQPYKIREYGGMLSPDDRKELISILTDPNSYLVFQTPGGGKLCGCIGHMAYMFATFEEQTQHKLDRIAIIVCHDCSAIVVSGLGARIYIDTDYSADRFLDLTRELFSDDSLTTQIYELMYGKH